MPILILHQKYIIQNWARRWIHKKQNKVLKSDWELIEKSLRNEYCEGQPHRHRSSLLELLSELNNLKWFLISWALWQSLICLSSCPRLSNDTINIMYNVKFKEHYNVHQDNPQNLLPLHNNNYKVDNVENEENTW